MSWVELAWELYMEFVRSAIELNVYTLDIMFNALCKKRRYARAKEILIEMLNIGPGPDTTTQNTLPVGSCRKDNSSETEEIFGEMLCQGVVPDLVSFSSLIAVFSRSKYLDQASVYFGDMKKSGLVLDNVIHAILINGFCKNCNMLEALKIRDEMLE
ncbi:hypothetical protein NC652_023278 [Populus alba x Populus x berolinensis]|nr:hypothetical protein NC652_023278 [Populus alba x Populus x berolinensis]